MTRSDKKVLQQTVSFFSFRDLVAQLVECWPRDPMDTKCLSLVVLSYWYQQIVQCDRFFTLKNVPNAKKKLLPLKVRGGASIDCGHFEKMELLVKVGFCHIWNVSKSKIWAVSSKNNYGRMLYNVKKIKNNKLIKWPLGDLFPPLSPVKYLDLPRDFVPLLSEGVTCSAGRSKHSSGPGFTPPLWQPRAGGNRALRTTPTKHPPAAIPH